jgi:nitrous-oxide reductase
MEGILLVRPKGYKGGPIGSIDQKLTKEELAKYKKNYEEKLKVIKQTQDVINSVVDYLKKNHYEKYPYVKALVADAFDQLNKGKEAEKKYKQYAKEGKWKQAFLWAEQYFQYQVKTADVGLRAKKLLSEKLAQDK